MKQLQRLMYLQGERCFFCNNPIPAGESSIEHLVASANGGSNSEENCVACCKTLNALLGSKPLKEKIHIILNQRGRFQCPKQQHATETPATDSVMELPVDPIIMVIADLQKRGPHRPKGVQALRNTVGALFKNEISEQEIDALLEKLILLNYAVIEDKKVTYLPIP